MQHKTRLNLPFQRQWFVMNGGDSEDLNHHHANKTQRYAFDFTRIDENGHSFKNDGKANEDYYAFGEPVLAPAEGVIVEAVDGVRDNLPSQGNYLAGAGNYIIIQHSSDEFSFIAHIKQGSVKVKLGDSVRRGQQLGECGNSGQSFAPHLHYHLQDTPLLDQYIVTYEDYDLRKSPFPKLDIEGYIAKGIKVYFSDIEGSKKNYSPIRGNLVRSSKQNG